MGRDRTILPHPARPLSGRGSFPRTAGAGVLIAGLACSGDVPFASPGTGVAVTVRTYHCSGGCGTATGPVDTVRRGDTALVRVSIADTAGDSMRGDVVIDPPVSSRTPVHVE